MYAGRFACCPLVSHGEYAPRALLSSVLTDAIDGGQSPSTAVDGVSQTPSTPAAAEMSKQHCRMLQSRMLLRHCCFDKVERCFDIVASTFAACVDRAWERYSKVRKKTGQTDRQTDGRQTVTLRFTLGRRQRNNDVDYDWRDLEKILATSYL